MYISSIKKVGLTFAVLNIFLMQAVMADILFYYSASVLPAIIANKPVADAGVDKTGIAIGEDVILDASASSDPNDDTLTYEWVITLKPEDSTAVLSSVTDISTTFTTDTAGSYTVTLTVSDGHLDDDDNMMITVDAAPLLSTLKKTGQTISYADFDDGDYQIGVAHSYTRDDGNETVTDNVTGLMWQDNDWAAYTNKYWSTAFTYCSTLTLGIYSDWRLPTRSELVGIADYGRSSPAIDPEFINTADYYYWSATGSVSDATKAWYVSFDDGGAVIGTKDYNRRVRCVRP